jgi:CheY-like chemotaxis protein
MMGAQERRILVVDDEAAIRLAIAELLETEGYVVDAARDGAEALEAMHRNRPALAIVDLMMPVLDGWTLLRTCRSDPALADVPVIVMSARLDAQQAAVTAGARACLIKPFDVNLLLTALEATFQAVPACAVCGASGAPHELPIFAAGSHSSIWRLCGQCWNLLETGFAATHPRGSLDGYVQRPGFEITDTEVRSYVGLGLSSVSSRGSSQG